eukprot:gene11280-11367_t
MSNKFTRSNYHSICDELAAVDADLDGIIKTYGYPPLWSRPNTFETLVHIILEQQVSLASALSALNKLKESIQEITPARILLLTDDEMRSCYCSRQKTTYIRYLAEALLSGQLKLDELEQQPDEIVRAKLTTLKGIGNWTADVYLMFVLQHADVFPIGDLAAGGNRSMATIPNDCHHAALAFLSIRSEGHSGFYVLLYEYPLFVF